MNTWMEVFYCISFVNVEHTRQLQLSWLFVVVNDSKISDAHFADNCNPLQFCSIQGNVYHCFELKKSLKIVIRFLHLHENVEG